MAENLSFYDKIRKNFLLEKVDIRRYSPTVLAYIGDAVLEMIVRTCITNLHHNKVSNINRICSNYVKASSQAKMVRFLLETNALSEEEKAFYKRGRNANSLTVAKHAKLSEYKMSTGFEAFLGALYLTDRIDRAIEIVKIGMEVIDSVETEGE